MRFTAAVLAATILVGCATQYWRKPGGTEEDFRMDQGQCQAQALSAPNPQNQPWIYNSCMRGKGWTLS